MMNDVMSRRKLFNQISVVGSGLIGVVVSVPIVAYLLSPFFNKPKREWQDVGAVSDFEINKTVQVNIQDPSPLPWAGETALSSAWLRRSTSGFVAF